MIFLTSNLGASEMCALDGPRLGFSPALDDVGFQGGRNAKMSSVGAAAARRKFTPEFINRLDKMIVFKPLGEEELHQVLDIELVKVQLRLRAAVNATLEVNVDETARKVLLSEGTDSRYGARHLKRAIERLLVQPLSNLLASGQIRRGDYVLVSHREGSPSLMFFREAMARDGWRVAGSIAA
jgi:ATP-dependent Clp protease ATP-binding subunit ClpA